MGKNLFLLVLCLAIIGLGVRYQRQSARGGASVGAAAHAGQSAEEIARQKQAAAEAEALKKKLAAEQAARAQIEAALPALKVTSILLGDPAIVIVNKKEYGVGDSLPLPDGKLLPVTAITEDGVALSFNGQAFHLPAPAAPDLAAGRKTR